MNPVAKEEKKINSEDKHSVCFITSKAGRLSQNIRCFKREFIYLTASYPRKNGQLNVKLHRLSTV